MEPTHIWRDREGTSHTAEQPNVNKDTLDSSSSSVRYSTNRYHFHGLATTQTQREGCAENEGSQKENAPASGDINASLEVNPQPCSPRPSTSKILLKVPNLDVGQLLGNKGADASVDPPLTLDEHLRSKATKAVSFQSPRATPASASSPKTVQPNKTMPLPSAHYYRRSPSQDSFGGPVSPDPEKQFFASTRKFDVPLSELGLVSTQQTLSSETQPALPPEAGSSMIQTKASAYSDDKRGHATAFRSSPHHGRVLVAATPSHSGSSQGDISQQSNDAEQFYGRQQEPTFNEIPDTTDNTQKFTQFFEDSSEPSSSYERLLAGEPATQPAEFQATQADETGIDLDVQMVVRGDDNDGPPTRLQTPGASSVPSTGPRSIVSLVDRNKPWRLQKHGIVAPAHLPPQFTYQTPSRREVIPETQPSGITDRAVPDGRQASRGDSRVRLNNALAHPLLSPRPDAMDIIPDSEPPPAGTNPLTPTRTTASLTRGLPAPGRRGQARPHLGDVRLGSIAGQIAASDVDEDDEDDIPLAAARVLKIGLVSKGKGKVATTRVADGDVTINNSRHVPQGQSLENAVPSSAPEQDVVKLANAGIVECPSRVKKGRGIKPPSFTSNRKTRSASAQSNVPAKRRRISSDTEDNDEFRLTFNNSTSIPEAEKEEEEETEPADENDMDLDVQDDDRKPRPSTRKRKQEVTSMAGSKKVSGAFAKPNISTRSTPAISSRPNKRLRSVVSSSRAASGLATRVFALWKQDSYYYSGTVHCHSNGSSTKYLVKFDDGTQDNIDVSKLRRCELTVDDEVILVGDDRRAKVKEIQNNQPAVTVEVDDGDEVEVFDVDVQDIRIAGRTIQNQWQDRVLTQEMITPVLNPKPLKATPSPSKASLLSATSTKGGRGKALNRVGLVITSSPGNDNWEKIRDNVILTIKNNGGTVIEDWSHIFPMDGIHSNSNKRWVAVANDVRWVSKDGIQRVFLLADDANQKPKFLIALALGIPCLSFDWLHDTVEKVSILTSHYDYHGS